MIVPTRDLALAARPGFAADVRACHDRLVAPLAALPALDLDPALIRCEIARPGTALKAEVDLLIDYSYSVRYQESLVPLAHLIPETAPANIVLAAIQPFACGDVVVGTCRAAWDDLEALDLFEVPPPGRWPHELLGQPFGELGKFAVHPVVDALIRAGQASLAAAGDAYRVALWHRLTEAYTSLLLGRGRAFVYEVAPPRMQRFLERSGCRPIRVDQARPSTSAATRELRRRWSRYFQPNGPPDLQPHLYYRALEARSAPGSDPGRAAEVALASDQS